MRYLTITSFFRHVFGLKSGTLGTIGFLDEQTVIYPAGSNIIFYNQETKLQKFIHISEKSEGIAAVNISPNRRWLAVSEKGKTPTCIVHDLQTFRKRKVLQLTESDAKVSRGSVRSTNRRNESNLVLLPFLFSTTPI
jgi:hypothetical protein